MYTTCILLLLAACDPKSSAIHLTTALRPPNSPTLEARQRCGTHPLSGSKRPVHYIELSRSLHFHHLQHSRRLHYLGAENCNNIYIEPSNQKLGYRWRGTTVYSFVFNQKQTIHNERGCAADYGQLLR